MVGYIERDENERGAWFGSNMVLDEELLRGRFLPSNFEKYIFYAYQICTHGNKRVNGYCDTRT